MGSIPITSTSFNDKLQTLAANLGTLERAAKGSTAATVALGHALENLDDIRDDIRKALVDDDA